VTATVAGDWVARQRHPGGAGRSAVVRLNSGVVRQIDSPIGAAYEVLGRRAKKRDLLDLGQAAPQYPPAPEVIEHIGKVARHPHGGDYGEIPGLPHLREAFAAELSDAYQGLVDPRNVVVTAGCNQAFCLVASALAGPGDEIVLTLPYYFNHDMWLRMNGIRPVYLEPGPGLVPTVEAAEAVITARTRALVVVTPGNPTGVTVPPDHLVRLAAVAERHDIALVLDETYRSFRDTEQPPHPLFADPGWADNVVSLHSFSKDLAIPGYRVGAVAASGQLNREITKLLDCVAVCAPRIGQEAAWAGLTSAGAWRRDRARETAEHRRGFAAAMADRPGGFELVSAGGFFGWVRHPFPGRPTDDVVRALALDHDLAVISGTAFLPDDRGVFRVSVSNVGTADIADLVERLTIAGLDPRR
jgi:aspartate/methionine/tyrosine aminotransferase